MKLVCAGGLRQGHEQLDQVALAAGARSAQDALDLLADGSQRDAPQSCNLVERLAGEQTIGDFGLSWSQAIESVEHFIGKAEWLFGIGDQEHQVGFRAVAV